MMPAAPKPTTPDTARRSDHMGASLVFLSALFWSSGGTIARFIDAPDNWTVVFWRSFWAAAFLLAFMVWRDGLNGALRLFRDMGKPGLGVAVCFAIASSSFVVALSYTTVANVLLMQAGVPLLAALISWIFLRESVSLATWLAIAAVISGVAIMVSESFDGKVSALGDGLALLIAVSFATVTVITRRYAHVRMTPATCLGAAIAGVFAAAQASTLSTSGTDMGLLFAFGALNLGLGMALFTTGARLIPATYAALLGTFETVFGPVWVWLVHGETPSGRTLIGGAIIFTALIIHISLQFKRQAAIEAPIGTNLPN